jgi:predicted RNase H-like HicB family nuclease
VEREGGYSVQCLELLGAISEGETKKKALENIRDAIKGYLEAFPEESERLSYGMTSVNSSYIAGYTRGLTWFTASLCLGASNAFIDAIRSAEEGRSDRNTQNLEGEKKNDIHQLGEMEEKTNKRHDHSIIEAIRTND